MSAFWWVVTVTTVVVVVLAAVGWADWHSARQRDEARQRAARRIRRADWNWNPVTPQSGPPIYAQILNHDRPAPDHVYDWETDT